MLYYPEYDWIQNSIDAILDELRKTQSLIDKLKTSPKKQRFGYIFPGHMVKNPEKTFYFVYWFGQETRTLEYRISKN